MNTNTSPSRRLGLAADEPTRRSEPPAREKPTAGQSKHRCAVDLLVSCAHAAVILFLCGRIPALIIFLAAALLLTRLKASVSPKGQRLFGLVGTLLLTLLLFRFRAVSLFEFVENEPWISRTLRKITSLDLHFLGLSYFYLRSVALMLEERRLRFLEAWSYLLFAPTFLSGPVFLPVRYLEDRVKLSVETIAEITTRGLFAFFKITLAQWLYTAIPLAEEDGSVLFFFPALDTANYIYQSLLRWPTGALWIGVFLSGFWLYLNFSGFSDLYIGLSLLCGRRAPENFERPFHSTNLTSFWQGWHMSLGTWLRNIVYNPLSRFLLQISRVHKIMVAAFCSVVTMAACGVWHGLSLKFAIWGLWHGVGLAIHSMWRSYGRPAISDVVLHHGAYRLACWFVTHAFVAVGWLFFLPTSAQISIAMRLHLLATLFGMR